MRMLLAAIAFIAQPAVAQAQLPRTPDGKPDLQGFWGAEFITPLERPDGFDTLVVPREQAAEAAKKMTPEIEEVTDPEIHLNPFPTNLLEMNGELRSSILIAPADGKLPLTALAQAAAKQTKSTFDGPENRPGPERCVDGLSHPPLRAINMLIPFQIVQTPQAIALTVEDIDPVRIITFGVAPLPDTIRTRAGQSRGRWEGDTLVIETDHFAVGNPNGVAWRDAALVTADSKTIERLTLVAPDRIHYQYTVEDPSLYREPWLAEYTLQRTSRPVYEYACHEGNLGIMNILLAARLGKQEAKKN